jgi:hypothetical protein
MEDKEFDLCNRKCENFMKRNEVGKYLSKELLSILQRVFREGYKLGKEVQEGEGR